MRTLPCTHGSFRIIPRYCSSFVNLAGMPIDRKFADRYYELSQVFDHVDYFSGVLLGLILGLAFLIAAYGIEAGSERLRRILDSLLALRELAEVLATLPADADAEAIQFELYEVGKRHPFPDLKTWFQALYEILLGTSRGPRMGSFIALYGIPETVALIRRALAGKAMAES